MGLVVQEIDQDVDFPALARCLLEAYEDPPQKFLHIFFPINGSGAEAREAAIQEAAERLKLWHTHDPTSHWQKVVDIDTGRLVGGASWNVYTTNPFTEPHALDVTWFPDDSSRVYVEKALENYGLPRAEVAQKPHICKSTVRPYRHMSSPIAFCFRFLLFPFPLFPIILIFISNKTFLMCLYTRTTAVTVLDSRSWTGV